MKSQVYQLHLPINSYMVGMIACTLTVDFNFDTESDLPSLLLSMTQYLMYKLDFLHISITSKPVKFGYD